MFKKAKDFNWDICKEIAVLTAIEVVYAVMSADGNSWSFVSAGFGIANNPEEGVKVLYTEEWHPWPF